MSRNALQRVDETEPPRIGSWAAVPTPMAAELVADVGYDFVAVDAEHTPVSDETVADMLRGIDAAGETTTVVRVADDHPTTLKRTLDLGPDAILVPMVETVAGARDVVANTRYPPAGNRGVGPGRATGYGRSVETAVAAGDDAFARHVQLESPEAVANAEAIASVDGIDGVFIGPMDLSLALDRYGDWDDERFRAAVETVVTAARDAGVALGTFATSEAEREERLGWDVDYLVAGVDLLHLARGASDALEHARRTAAPAEAEES